MQVISIALYRASEVVIILNPFSLTHWWAYSNRAFSIKKTDFTDYHKIASQLIPNALYSPGEAHQCSTIK